MNTVAAALLGVVLLGGCSAAPPTETAVTAAITSSSAVASATTRETASSDAVEADFAPLNSAVGFGLLRVMTLEERPAERDVVIYPALPNEMPRVAGVITTVMQTPLSHVNLRAVQDNVPNAFVAAALDDPAITELVGRYVRYEVTTEGFTVVAATQEEVEAHHAAARPTTGQTPERDLSVRSITPLSEIGFDDWTAFGVKAANVATLATFDLGDTEVPDGYALPFSFYDEFMTANGLYDQVAEMLDDPEFRADPDEQERQLAALREAIKDAASPEWIVAELTKVQQSFPVGTPIRCRSSTNNEDLPGFSGAGLYDSRTQHPDEGHIEKCIKQVYASVWNLRAFLERDFYRIDHLATAMGVLLHPNSEGEEVNGVAVSFDPVYETPGAHYVNSQLGEDLVTNPDALSTPEALLVDEQGVAVVITRSNLVTPGEMLLSDGHIAALRTTLDTIHDRFAELYGVESGQEFAMEIEFKITDTGSLFIKQARTWVFNS